MLAATSLLLLARVRGAPVAVDRALGDVSRETLPVVVEDRKLVFAQDVSVRLGVKPVCYLRDGVFEIARDTRIQIAFGVASNVDGSLICELTNAINAGVGVAVATHCRRREGDGMMKTEAIRRR